MIDWQAQRDILVAMLNAGVTTLIVLAIGFLTLVLVAAVVQGLYAAGTWPGNKKHTSPEEPDLKILFEGGVETSHHFSYVVTLKKPRGQDETKAALDLVRNRLCGYLHDEHGIVLTDTNEVNMSSAVDTDSITITAYLPIKSS